MARDSVSFGFSLCASCLLHLSILLLNGLLVSNIYQNNAYRVWFLPCLGLILLPSVTVQLVSAVLLLVHKGDKLTTASSAGLGGLHILQLGFVWRHISLYREVDPKNRSLDTRHLSYLQLLWTFASLLPLVFIQTFLILYHQEHDWVLLSTAAVTSFGTCFYLASYRQQKDNGDYDLVTCNFCSALFKLTWRMGEVTSRILCLVVFTTVYSYWIFLIIGLHGITMLVCLCTAILDMLQEAGYTRTRQNLTAIMVAYIFTFVFINFKSQENSVFKYVFYYTVMFLENAVLLIVWYLHADELYTGAFDKHVILAVSASAFGVGIVSLIIYSKCFSKIPLFDSETEHIYTPEECINCRLSLCSKHNIKLQRPFSAGWMSQYQEAVEHGNYYKNILQDNYIDSDGASSADILNSSGEHCQIRDTDLDSMKTSQNMQTTIAVQASGTYTHKRFFDSNSSIANFTDTDSISSGSGVYEEDWRQKSVDTIFTQLSAMDALSLVSSRTQLLTDSWDSLLKDEKTTGCSAKHPKKIDILNSLIKKDLDTSYFSDGYTTDHTLESYQLPVTVLAKKRSDRYNRKRIESAYSTASDSTDCTICAFMRQNPSSPEETRKHLDIPDNIHELWSAPVRKKRRDCAVRYTNSRRHNLSTDQSGSERSYTHKYEKASSRNRRTKCDAVNVENATSKRRNILDVNYADHYRVRTRVKSDLRPRVNNSAANSYFNKHVPVETKVLKALAVSSNIRSHENSQSSSALSGKCVRDTSSDSGDSAFPRCTPVSQSTDLSGARRTPLSVYLAATDGDKDGTSESSCEMII